MSEEIMFNVGDKVENEVGDYTYRGVVVSVCGKLSGAVRYVVENEDGMLFIFNGKSLKPNVKGVRLAQWTSEIRQGDRG